MASDAAYAHSLLFSRHLHQLVAVAAGALNLLGYAAMAHFGARKENEIEEFRGGQRGGLVVQEENEAGAMLTVLGLELRAEREREMQREMEAGLGQVGVGAEVQVEEVERS